VSENGSGHRGAASGDANLTREEHAFHAPDGSSLFGQLWVPRGDVVGVVCLVHGIGEHSGRYGGLAVALGRAQLPHRIELGQTGLSETDGMTHLEYRVVR